MQQKSAADRFAPLFILTAGAMWGSMGLFVRVLGKIGCSSFEIVFLRSIVTAVCLFLVLAVRDRSLFRVRLRDLWCFLGTGLLSIVFFNLCYFTTIRLTSLAVAAVLLYTAPAIVIVLSAILFREKITSRKLSALVLTLVGCICVSGMLAGDSAMTLQGFIVGLGAGLGYALYSIFGRFALERGYRSFTISFYTFLFASVGTIPFISMSNIRRAVSTSPSQTGLVVLYGVFTTVLPYILYTRGLQGVENGQAAIIASVEPVVATILGTVIYHEMLSLYEVIGIVLVLGAIVISNGGDRGRFSVSSPKETKNRPVTVQTHLNSRCFCVVSNAKTRVKRRSPHSRSEFGMGERKLLSRPSRGREQ